MGTRLPVIISGWYANGTRNLLTGVPFVKNSPRAPLGPSVVLTEGMPLLEIGIDLQKSAPASSET